MATTYYQFQEADIATAQAAYTATILPQVLLAGGVEAIYSIPDESDGTENLIIHVPSSVTDPVFALAAIITPAEYLEKVNLQSKVKIRFPNGSGLDTFLATYPYISIKAEPLGVDFTLITMTVTAYNLNRFSILDSGGVRL